jgi:hypothetical protein
VLSIAKLSAGQEDYILKVEDEFVDAASGAAGYYTDAREAPGRWAGAGARGFGCAVAVDGCRVSIELDARFLLRRTEAWRSVYRPRLRRHGPRCPGA